MGFHSISDGTQGRPKGVLACPPISVTSAQRMALRDSV